MNETQRVEATDQAIKIIPGISAAKFRKDREGALTLLHGYQQECRSAGLTEADAWSCMTAAALVWLEGTVQSIADVEEISPDRVLREMGLRTMRAGT